MLTRGEKPANYDLEKARRDGNQEAERERNGTGIAEKRDFESNKANQVACNQQLDP